MANDSFETREARAIKRASKRQDKFNNLPDLDAAEKELCLQYINGNDGAIPKIKAIGKYKTRNTTDLRSAKNKVELYIQTYMEQM